MILISPVLDYQPERIVSLVPSQTELLYYLGLEKEMAGITKFCVHPEAWFRNKTRIGGTKSLHTQKIEQLNPDLIIANKEENVKEQVETLAENFPVWLTDVNNLDDSIQMINDIGQLTRKTEKASELTSGIKTEFLKLEQSVLLKKQNPVRTAYLIWKDPYMTVGGDTFINDMMHHAGFENIFSGALRYPEININRLRELNCELLLLSSEPYPFSEKHIAEIQTHLPAVKIFLADGEMFSWYGSRLLLAPSYFKKLGEGFMQKI